MHTGHSGALLQKACVKEPITINESIILLKHTLDLRRQSQIVTNVVIQQKPNF